MKQVQVKHVLLGTSLGYTPSYDIGDDVTGLDPGKEQLGYFAQT